MNVMWGVSVVNPRRGVFAERGKRASNNYLSPRRI